MAVADLILKTLDPKIAPPSIEIRDLETNNNPNERIGEGAGFVKQSGKFAPLVKIGNTMISDDLIMAFNVYSTSLIPTMHLAIIDPVGTFTSMNYPRTNLLVTAFVASTHPKLKSFSQTFIITSVASIPLGNNSIRYDFFGELYIPKLNGNFIKSYNKKTSGETLRTVAEELGLGFATNDGATNDSMTWINPNLNYKSFIKLVADHAYKNEKSFFECFIDRYYVLNFINVEKQFNQTAEIEQGYSTYVQNAIDTRRSKTSSDQMMEDAMVPLVLTNSTRTAPNSDLRIIDYSMLGENGSILNTEGFRKRSVIYKHGDDSPVKDWFAEPISSPTQPRGPIHQTPDMVDYTETDVVKWMGTDYGNAHDNYKFAKIINSHNRLETEKNLLQVKLMGFNHNIIRGSRVKVDLYSGRAKDANDSRMKDDLGIEDTNRGGGELNMAALGQGVEIIDSQLSDFYYVKEISYSYNPAASKPERFSTTMLLSRRSWLPSPKKELTV